MDNSPARVARPLPARATVRPMSTATVRASTASGPDAEMMWSAFLARDPRWDGRFVAAIRTTGVFCRPSCTCRRPLRRNVRFYRDPDAAMRAGFRPCKRCRPELAGGAAEADRRLAARALALMRRAPGEPWTVSRLAHALAMSPSSFTRHFRAGAGTTPVRALATVRLERARALLDGGARVLDAALELGFGSGSALSRAWRRRFGAAPRAPRPRRRRTQ
jgi:methylphosphotriester-DNA--protein-cysteine methyltransferase